MSRTIAESEGCWSTSSSTDSREAAVTAGRLAYLEAMALSPAATTVVTTDGPAGRIGQTVTAMTSVCADPPTMLFCIKGTSPLAEAVASNGSFAVNVLACHQEDLANSFAGRSTPTLPAYTFDTNWRSATTGAPVHRQAAAYFDCSLTFRVHVGTHYLCLGQVAESGHRTDDVLTYGLRSFGRHAPSTSKDEAGR